MTRSLPLPSAGWLNRDLPNVIADRIRTQRSTIKAVINGSDKRFLVVIGPCSIHNRVVAHEYAKRLITLSTEMEKKLLLVMRTYVEKPRTTVGWKGLVYDPYLDGSHDMVEGLMQAWSLMLDIIQLGLPVGNEILNPLTVTYFIDMLGWSAIGARTTSSQIHREIASWMVMPIGFKNSPDGKLEIACDAMKAARFPHSFLGVYKNGQSAMIDTPGNCDTHIVLRGGYFGPSSDAESVEAACLLLPHTSIMVDCSHANSEKYPKRQQFVLDSVLDQRITGKNYLIGVMLESNIKTGHQAIKSHMRYGVSITDSCLGLSTTARLLRYAAVRIPAKRRASSSKTSVCAISR